MVVRIPEYPEYISSAGDEDCVEIQRVLNGASYKISPSSVGLRGGVALPNLTGAAGANGVPGGTWGGGIGGATSQILNSTGSMYLCGAFFLRAPITITGLACVVLTPQAASAARIGIYSANSDWSLNALVADFGTVDSSTSGRKEITGLSTVLQSGQYYTSFAVSVANVSLQLTVSTPFTISGTASIISPTFTTASMHTGTWRQTATTPAASGFAAPSSSVLIAQTTGTRLGTDVMALFQWTEN